jgi:hypothetical protein
MALRLLLIGLIALFASTVFAQSQPPPANTSWVTVSPGANQETIGKRPEIKGTVLVPFKKETIVIILDNTDVTQLLRWKEGEFSYKPLAPLPAGKHTLKMTAQDPSGRTLEAQVPFSSRHTASFAEVATNNDLSLNYENALHQPDSMGTTPSVKMEGNLKSETRVREQEWGFAFNTNLRYLDQNQGVSSPQKKGLDVANYLLTGTYSRDAFNAALGIGDVMVGQSPYAAADLARRGQTFSVDYDRFGLSAFNIKSEQVFGLGGGAMGPDYSDNGDYIRGIVGTMRFFDKKMEFKTLYVTGVDSGNSYNTTGIVAPRKGETLGLLLSSNFFQQKLKTDFEVDFSWFDPDTSDTTDRAGDKAYRLSAGGISGQYTYGLLYEHIGKDFSPIGSPALVRDREGGKLNGGANFEGHAVNLLLSGYVDNVENNALLPRIRNYQGVLSYVFSKLAYLPMNVTLQKDIQNSEKEPAGVTPVKLDTTSLSGGISYVQPTWNAGFVTSYAYKDDQQTDRDSEAITYALNYTLNKQWLVFAPSVALSQAREVATGVRLDTYTVGVALNTKFWEDRIFFEWAGTYNAPFATDDSTNNRNLNMNARLAYSLKDWCKGVIIPTIAIKSSYVKYTDRVNPALDQDNYSVFLVLTLSAPYVY